MDTKYDVGFSFQSDDQKEVEKIYRSLSPNFSIFFAPEKQRELFTEDQTLKFSSIFKSTKINFIFLGDQYGKTKWTRFEEEIIKNKALEDGWQSVGIVKMNRGVNNLKWYPPNLGYIKHYEHALKVLAGILKYAIETTGVNEKVETLTDLARRKKEEAELKEKIKNYPGTQRALSDALREVRTLIYTLEEGFNALASDYLHTVYKKFLPEFENSTFFILTHRKYELVVRWNNEAYNMLSNSYLEVFYAERDSTSSPLFRYVFNVALSNSDEFVWSDSTNSENQYSTEELVDRIMRMTLEYANVR